MEKILDDLKAAMVEGRTLDAHDALSAAMREYHRIDASKALPTPEEMIGEAA